MQTQERKLKQLKLAVNTLTKERDELKRDNAAWKKLHKKIQASNRLNTSINEGLSKDNARLKDDNVNLRVENMILLRKLQASLSEQVKIRRDMLVRRLQLEEIEDVNHHLLAMLRL